MEREKERERWEGEGWDDWSAVLQGREMNERGEEQDLLLTWGGGSKREALWRGGGGVVPTPKRKRRDTGQASGVGGREAGEGMSKRLRNMREGREYQK